MKRFVVSLVMFISAFALSLDASGLGCEMQHEMDTAAAEHTATPMSCHKAMMDEASSEQSGELPSRTMDDACCCPVVLSAGIILPQSDIDAPFRGVTAWVHPMPDSSHSHLIEYEPPPPRA